MVGHSVELRATFEREPDLDEAIAALEAFPTSSSIRASQPATPSRRDCRGRCGGSLRPALAHLFVIATTSEGAR